MNCQNGFDLSLIETIINLCKDEEQSKAKYEKEFIKYKKLAPGKISKISKIFKIIVNAIFKQNFSAALPDDFEGFVLDETSLSSIWSGNDIPDCEDSIKKKIKILKKNVDDILR